MFSANNVDTVVRNNTEHSATKSTLHVQMIHMYVRIRCHEYRPGFYTLHALVVYTVAGKLIGSMKFLIRLVILPDLLISQYFFVIITDLFGVRGSNSGGARFSARPDRSWGPPCLLYNGYQVFSGGKVRTGRAADHSPFCVAVMEQ